MAVIQVPAILQVAHGKCKAPALLSNGSYEYEVSEEMKKYWDKLSMREKENLLSLCFKQDRDFRDVLSESM